MMIKKTFVPIFICLSIVLNAQISEVYKELKRINFSAKDNANGWYHGGNLSISINQTHYENWTYGGSGNIDLQTMASKNIGYRDNDIIWDNHIYVNYGINKTYGQEFRKTRDRLELNSIFGKTSPNKWSYSFFINFQTQLSNSYLFDNDTERQFRLSGFLAPAYLSIGPGVMWGKKENMNFNLAPLTAKTIYINGEVFKFNKETKNFKSNKLTEIYGVAPNEIMENKLGFYASAYLNMKILNKVYIENRLALYTNYLKDLGNIDINYEMLIKLKVNNYISTNLNLNAIYDDNAFNGFQLKESFGVSVNLNI